MGQLDFTSRYNTPLNRDEEAAFQGWLAQTNRESDLLDYDLRGAWKANAQAAANGHLPDTWKKPNHPTFSDESQYNGQDGYKGGQWVQDNTGRWGYYAAPTNLENYGAVQLQQYFQKREPDSLLVYPDFGVNLKARQ